jgi:hypothetical protein
VIVKFHLLSFRGRKAGQTHGTNNPARLPGGVLSEARSAHDRQTRPGGLVVVVTVVIAATFFMRTRLYPLANFDKKNFRSSEQTRDVRLSSGAT